MESKFLTTPEVAKMLRLSTERIRQLCESKEIKARRTMGNRGQWRIYRDQFEKQFEPEREPVASIEKPDLQFDKPDRSIFDFVKQVAKGI
jgi:excisionase family DNA binding protein